MASMSDPVNHPSHYHSTYLHAACGSRSECIDVVRHMNFDVGNAVKYCWRAGAKGDEVEDLEKAIWYLQDRISEIKRLREESKLVEKPAPFSYTFPAPDIWGKTVTIPCSDAEPPLPTVAPMPTWDECTVRFPENPVYNLLIIDAGSAASAWGVWNRDTFYLDMAISERQRGRDELLGLISKLPAAEFGKLSEHIQETVNDWIQALRA